MVARCIFTVIESKEEMKRRKLSRFCEKNENDTTCKGHKVVRNGWTDRVSRTAANLVGASEE